MFISAGVLTGNDLVGELLELDLLELETDLVELQRLGLVTYWWNFDSLEAFADHQSLSWHLRRYF